uniref:Uncharacterized protein n=1 Tax=Timema tahoe TaxID=61484 RepID=A0A7R9NV38_9NEOP|nr:unnamed protein product [Timema tahoe]
MSSQEKKRREVTDHQSPLCDVIPTLEPPQTSARACGSLAERMSGHSISAPLPLSLLLLTISTIALQYCLAEESPKRAPSGFLGMRGKKDDMEAAFNDEMDKRAPSMMGFQGMRGKKDNDLGDYAEKRAPGSGFMGMRGKKDPDSEFYDKRAPSSMGFHGMRGKKDQDFQETDYFEKRAPMGFQGMRGKKDGYGDDVDDDYFGGEKRMGFLGMRGKKEDGDYSEIGDDDSELEDGWPQGMDAFKRSPSSGFFGMRGKKVPSQGFFGLRGKKAPGAGFVGMRGKKAPGAGFVGMRGKKEDIDGEDLDALLYYLNSNLVEASNREKRYPTNVKKAPSGFLGMRGKKDWSPSMSQAYKMTMIEGEGRGYTQDRHKERKGVVVKGEHVTRMPWKAPEQCSWQLGTI